MKSTYYPDAGLEQMVPDQFWIEEECKYDIAAMYGISHWWFQRQRFYIDRHTSEGDRSAVRTHIRILSVVRIEVFSMYGYDYIKQIVLRRGDLNEHVIAKRDFKYLYPSDFEDLYLLNLKGHLNHLPPKDKKIITTADESRFKYEVLDQKGRGSEQGVHVRHSKAVKDKKDLPQSGELCWWTRQRWRLRPLQSVFKRISNMALLFIDVWNGSFRCRVAGEETGKVNTGKPCQGDSAEFYLITGSIYTDQRGTVVLETLFNESKQDTIVRLLLTYTCRNLNGCNCWPKRCQFTTPCLHFTLIIKDKMIAERPTT
nr:hypothetical protein [Tanacetum cinerariifolium]